MKQNDYYNQLLAIASSADFPYDSGLLIESWEDLGVGREAIDPILRFMELYPDVDYGSPGALVHFVEKFHDDEYEDKVAKSVARVPTMHTSWMLNRLVNSASDSSRRSSLISVLRSAANHPDIDNYTKAQIEEYLGMTK